MSVSVTFNRVEAEATPSETPLVLAHGLLGQGRNFGSLAKKLSTNRTVISVDMRNHGDSPWYDRMDYRAMADDLSSVIEAECGGRAHLLGHSMGGKAAMVAALTRPDLLASLIVADIAPVSYDHSYVKQIEAMRSIGLEGITRRQQADDILSAKIPQKPMRAFLLQNLSLSDGKARWKPNLDVLAETMGTITGWPALRGESVFEGPTLFVRGADSDYVLEDHKEQISWLFPAVEHVSITGAGHWLHAERPGPFFEAVRDFLTSTRE
jgi:pimeloyl-ACP methyl ester carboxylesterase